MRTRHHVLFSRGRFARSLAIAALATALSAFTAQTGTRYELTVLVANRPDLAPGALVDARLINPWGIALRPPGAGGHFWISNAGTLSSSTYVGDVSGTPLRQDGLRLVELEGPLLSYEDGIANVTGQVYNAASDYPDQPVEFPVSGAAVDLSSATPRPLGTISGSAKFVFVTTDGTINAWRASTAESMRSAPIVKDYSDHGRDQIHGLPSLPAFTGVAMSARHGATNRLYAADFQNGTIRVIDNQWTDITAQVPFERPVGLPAEFHPYNVQYLDGLLYVTFAVRDADADEPAADVPGPGRGRVLAYDLAGRIVRHFDDGGRLNSPWGLAIAPDPFGGLGGSLLVGNFGDGTIAAFDVATGRFRGYLLGKDDTPVAIEGLWGLAFGNGVNLGDRDSLYFTAGPNGEQDGVFGRLRVAIR